jgi:hypothetical protein
MQPVIGAGELAGALQLRMIECCVVDHPVPVRGTITKGFSAFAWIVSLPMAAPAKEGSKRTTTVDDWPGDSVPCSGDIETPAPITPAVPVTGEFPVYFNVTDKVDIVDARPFVTIGQNVTAENLFLPGCSSHTFETCVR